MILLMIQKSQGQPPGPMFKKTLKIIGFQLQTSTGELIPDFWLPSTTVWDIAGLRWSLTTDATPRFTWRNGENAFQIHQGMRDGFTAGDLASWQCWSVLGMAFWVNFESDVKIPPMFLSIPWTQMGSLVLVGKGPCFFLGGWPSNMEDKKVPGLNR